MAYFLGRDVKVAITTEASNTAIGFASSAIQPADSDNTPTGMHDRDVNTSDDANGARIFDTTYQTDGTSNSHTHETNPMGNVTGVEISLGAIDEDIAYMGKRTALKAEIKKETTVTITAKKMSNFYSLLFNEARYGVTDGAASSGTFAGNALKEPTVNFGFRLHIALDDTVEVITVKNAQMSEYSTTLNADGVTEETMTFISHVTPAIGPNPTTAVTTAAIL
tara:strand:- start:121 stop:786 length:666 start_codon:yes stop_codon:yes gene_type:complete